MPELRELAITAGARIVTETIQHRTRPDPATYIGKGKIEELRLAVLADDVSVVIVDDELTPGQARNIEEAIDARVVDRTGLILDIFAARARTKEGKLQVELALLNYQLTRLSGSSVHLSRLGGGIGTRGPGETKLEMDRRGIRTRIAVFKREIEQIRKHRSLHRERRKKDRLPLVSLVGYTNAGKSTLFRGLIKGRHSRIEPFVLDTRYLDPQNQTRRRVSGSDFRHGRIHSETAAPARFRISRDAGRSRGSGLDSSRDRCFGSGSRGKAPRRSGSARRHRCRGSSSADCLQ